MHLAATCYYALAHILYHTRQFVGTDVWMSIYKDILLCSVLMKNVQNTVYIASFLASGVEFAIGISTGATLAEAVVAIAIHHSLASYFCKVGCTVFHVLASFEHYGLYAEFYQAQSGK